MLWNSLYFSAVQFSEKLSTICHIYHKTDLTHVKSFDLPPFYSYHFTNGFCEDNKIILQFFKYDPTSTQSLFEMLFYIPKYTQGENKIFKGCSALSELSIDLDDFKYKMEDKEIHGEFPVCSDSLIGKKFRYSYMSVSSKPDELLYLDGVCQYDREKKETKILHE